MSAVLVPDELLYVKRHAGELQRLLSADEHRRYLVVFLVARPVLQGKPLAQVGIAHGRANCDVHLGAFESNNIPPGRPLGDISLRRLEQEDWMG